VAGAVTGTAGASTNVWTFTADHDGYDGIKTLTVAVDGTP